MRHLVIVQLTDNSAVYFAQYPMTNSIRLWYRRVSNRVGALWLHAGVGRMMTAQVRYPSAVKTTTAWVLLWLFWV
jgi:hypothetical protein